MTNTPFGALAMPRNTTKPDYYRTPLRSRSDIADHLASIGGYDSAYGRQGRSYFAFNVKCHAARLDFERLIEVHRNGGYYGDDETWLDDPEWLEQAREKHREVERHLFDWGVEDAARNDAALADGGRVLLAYTLRTGVRIWVITEAVGDDGRRASTCLLLPDEY